MLSNLWRHSTRQGANIASVFISQFAALPWRLQNLGSGFLVVLEQNPGRTHWKRIKVLMFSPGDWSLKSCLWVEAPPLQLQCLANPNHFPRANGNHLRREARPTSNESKKESLCRQMDAWSADIVTQWKVCQETSRKSAGLKYAHYETQILDLNTRSYLKKANADIKRQSSLNDECWWVGPLSAICRIATPSWHFSQYQPYETPEPCKRGSQKKDNLRSQSSYEPKSRRRH